MNKMKLFFVQFSILSLVSMSLVIALFYYYTRTVEYPLYIFKEVLYLIKIKDFTVINPQGLIYIIGAFLLPSLAFLDSPFTKGEYGNARWANISLINKMKLFAKSGMLLGYVGNISRKYLRFEETLSTIVVAPPKAGKTSAIAVPNLLSSRYSQFVTDIKGELWELTAGYRENFSKVYRFSPAHKNSCNWNPLHEDVLPKEWVHIVQYVERIAFALIPSSPNGSDNSSQNHFVEEGRSLFIFFALYLIALYGGTSLPDIRAFALSHADVQEWLNTEFRTVQNLPIRVMEEANSLAGKADKEFSGVFSTFKSKMNVFSDEITADNLRKNDFTFGEFRKGCTTLYITIQLRDIDRYAPLIRLIYELASYEFQAEEPKKDEFSIHFLADEFAKIGRVKQLLQIPEVGRSYRLCATYIFQSNGQIEEIYGKNGVDNLYNTTFAKVIFPQNDYKTAKVLCNDVIGKETRIKEGSSRSNRGFESSTLSQNKNTEGHNLILPQELLSLDENTIIIIIQGYAQTPIKAIPLKYFKDKTLSKITKQYKKEISWN